MNPELVQCYSQATMRAVAVGIFTLLACTPSFAVDRYVNPENPASYATIGAAVAASGPGDAIYVYPGVYAESVNLSAMAVPGNISLVAVDALGAPAAGYVTIDPSATGGPGTGNAIYNLVSPFPGAITISGFNVSGPIGPPPMNGILLSASGDVTIRDVSAYDCGAFGMYLVNMDGAVTISGCSAVGNALAGIETVNTKKGVTVSDCYASGNTGGGIILVNSDMEVTLERCTSEGNGQIGIQVVNAKEDILISQCETNANGVYGMQLVNADKEVTISECTTVANAADGINVVNVTGRCSVTRCTTEGNLWSGIAIFNASADATIDGCIATRSGRYGVQFTNLAAASTNRVSGNMLCDNLQGGLTLTAAGVTLDAKGNWWSDATGPNHPTNPGGAGNKVVDGANGGVGTASFTPWINTIAATAARDPVTLGRSDEISFVFSGGDGTVFLGEGPGDPSGPPPFIVATDNGALTGSSGTGSSVQEFIGADGTLKVTLVPDTLGVATVTLTGPCNLTASIAVDVTLNPLELFVRQNARTGNYTFAAGDTLVLEYQVNASRGGFDDGRRLDVILAAQVNPGKSDQVVTFPLTGGKVYVYGKHLSGPTLLNPRSIPRAFSGFAFPPMPDPLSGTLSFKLPGGAKGKFAFLGAVNSIGKLDRLSGIEASNEFEIE